MADLPTRREPPPFRTVEVVRVEERSPWMRRVTLGGEELAGLERGLPAASVRLLLPHAADGLVVPTWNGNEFLHDDGSRPLIRTLTPLRLDDATHELDVEVVLHGDSPLTTWARGGGVGTRVAVSGTGRGHEVQRDATAYVVLGDESALPAISTLLPELGGVASVVVVAEVRHHEAQVDLPAPEGAEVRWLVADPSAAPGARLSEALAELELPEGVHVWAAGEAAAVQRIRKHLFDGVGLDRRSATVRGYWKVGRAEGGGS